MIRRYKKDVGLSLSQIDRSVYHMMNKDIIPFIDENCNEMKKNENIRFLNKIKEIFNETN